MARKISVYGVDTKQCTVLTCIPNDFDTMNLTCIQWQGRRFLLQKPSIINYVICIQFWYNKGLPKVILVCLIVLLFCFMQKYRHLTITKCNCVKVFTIRDYPRTFLYSILVESNYSLHNSQVYYAKARIVVVYVVSDSVLQVHL